MKVIYESSRKEADLVKTFYFRPPKYIDYTAGQLIEITLPNDQPDERGIKHWFTLSSSPTEELLSITTKFDPDKSSTFKQDLLNMAYGQEVLMSDPMGDFVLPKDRSRPLVFVAGGIGITPMRSMIKWLSDTQEHRSIHLIYSAKESWQFIFRELFRDYGLPVTLTLSQPRRGWHGEVGQLDAKRILSLEPNVDNKLYFVSGPEPMTESLYKELKQLGVRESQLVTDYFPGYPTI